MRILHVLDHLDTRSGGPARSVAYLSHYLRQQGCEILIAYRRAGTVEPELRRFLGPESATLKVSPFTGQLASVAHGFDVVHFHSVFTPWDWWDGARCRRLANTPYIISPRGQLDDWSLKQARWKKALALRTLAGDFIRKSSQLHATAEGEREKLRRLPFRQVEITVAPNVIEPPILESRTELTPSPRPFTALFLGRLVEKKRPDLLVDALASISESLDWHVEFAGEGSEAILRAIESRARSLSVDERIRFLGFVPGDDRREALRRATVLVLPSSQENFAHSVFEALGEGTLVIVSDQLDVSPELEQCPGAFVVEQDSREIARVMVEISTMSADQRTAIRRRGRSWVRDYLDPTRIAGEYSDMYRRVSGRYSESG